MARLRPASVPCPLTRHTVLAVAGVVRLARVLKIGMARPDARALPGLDVSTA